jgi:hypothetical protein
VSDIIKGYKGFDKDLKCRDKQYEVGKEYIAPVAKCCNQGFHFCEAPLDVFGYYPPADSRYCDVEGGGDIDRDKEDSKVCCTHLKIGAEIGLKGIIDAGVKFILDRVKWDTAQESNTGYQSAATNTGDQSAATNTGDQSAATNTGNRSAATNTGDYSAATNTGDQSAATNTGDQSAATNTGYRSTATNTGNRSAATNTGDQSAATNTGDYSAATVEGKESVAMAIGYESKAKGALGCWLVLAEWADKHDGYHIVDVQSVKVDGEAIKADTFYRLVSGQFVEVE